MSAKLLLMSRMRTAQTQLLAQMVVLRGLRGYWANRRHLKKRKVFRRSALRSSIVLVTAIKKGKRSEFSVDTQMSHVASDKQNIVYKQISMLPISKPTRKFYL